MRTEAGFIKQESGRSPLIPCPVAGSGCSCPSGQSLLESCMVMAILCLLLMGVLQISQLFMAKEIINFSAGRGARAKTVGFNEFMVYKTVRVGAIANAGRMTSPNLDDEPPTDLTMTLGSRFRADFPLTVYGGPAIQREYEKARIPMYLGAEWHNYLAPILNYERWSTIGYNYSEQDNPPVVDFYVRQQFPLAMPLHQLFFADNHLPFTGRATLENHYPLYMDIQ